MPSNSNTGSNANQGSNQGSNQKSNQNSNSGGAAGTPSGAGPSSITGDILAAMQAEQANAAALYQLQQTQAQTLVSLGVLQQFANEQLKKQTKILTDIYTYLLKKWGPPVGTPQPGNSQNRAQQGQSGQQGQPAPGGNASTVSESPQMSMLSDLVRDNRRHNSALENFIQQQSAEFQRTAAGMQDTLDYVNSLQIGPSASFESANEMFDLHGLDEQSYADIQKAVGDKVRDQFNLGLSNSDLSRMEGLDFQTAQQRYDLGSVGETQFADLQKAIAGMSGDMAGAIADATGAAPTPISGLEELAGEKAALINSASSINTILQGLGKTPGSGAGAIRGAGDVAGGLAGEAVGGLAGDALSGALVPVLGPLAPVVGQIGGEIVGKQVEKTIGAAFDALGDLWASLEESGRKTRDKIINAGFEKIQHDVRDMGTYQVEIYEQAAASIYNAWDKNLSTVSATMGYTKEAVNSLQDSVAKRLDEQGYSQAINAANYVEELSSVLSANLGGKLAEVFASQSLILEKAIPQFDATSMASQFAAIYTNAEKEGKSGETAMVEAMNQIAGATKAIQDTTDGNNQFIKSVPAFLQKAEEIVARAGGSVDNIAALTTEMMAAEGPLAALAPQLSGFTGELVDILTKQNDSTAVALRSIMHDINSDVGISATDFMQSFMDDTKGTLVTAFEAIDSFIQENENPAARQEFLTTMESLFGIQGDKLAQLDFGYLGEQLSQTNAHLNTSALLDAEDLLKSGETTSLEEQLVNNTANMLLSQNSVRDTLDNKLMRKIEQNELNMEKLVWEASATQSVELAESTMGFFTKIKDIIIDLLDPLGLFKAANSAISGSVSAAVNAANYALTANLSSIGSDVASDVYGATATLKNTVGGAAAVIAAANATGGNALAVQTAMTVAGTAGSYQEMVARHALESIDNQSAAAATAVEASAESAVGNYENTVEEQQKQAEKKAADEEQDRLRQQAADENAAVAAADAQREVDNHDSLMTAATTLPAIQDNISGFASDYQVGNQLLRADTAALNAGLSSFAETYIQGNQGLTDSVGKVNDNGIPRVVKAIEDSKADTSELSEIRDGVQRVITLFSTYLEFIDKTMSPSDKSGLQMSYSDRAQILGEGLFV